MNVQEEIFKTIETIVQKYVEKLNLTRDLPGVVLGTDNGKYVVSVNGGKYLLKDGVKVSPKVNTSVWVRVPNNDFNQAYICATK